MNLREQFRKDKNPQPNITAAILYYGYLHYPKGFKMNDEAILEIKRLSELPDAEFQELINDAIKIRKSIE